MLAQGSFRDISEDICEPPQIRNVRCSARDVDGARSGTARCPDDVGAIRQDDISIAGKVEEAAAEAPRRSAYSPYPARDDPTRVLWGDAHLHTSLSLDARGMRLRQRALVARELAPFVEDLRQVLGLGTPYGDPGGAILSLDVAEPVEPWPRSPSLC